MITALLLLPVLSVLLWLYWYLLPQGRAWTWFDSFVLMLLVLLAGIYVRYIHQQEWPGGGPLWPELLSVVGAYAILVIGLALGLLWRRREI